MSWQRLFTFKPGTKISSKQVNEELDQLIAAVNNIEAADKNKDTALRKIAQLSKITSDSGAVKLNITDTKGDVLTELQKLGQGVHTFYAVGGSKNLPPSNLSIRGIAHFTSTNYAWVLAFDYKLNVFTNFLDSGTWLGWNPVVTANYTQSILWTGAVFVQGNQTIKPTKKLSECRNGWILVWSDYDPSPDNKTNDYDVAYSYIPKNSPFVNGHQNIFTVPSYASGASANYVNKKIRVFNDRLEGFDDNNSSTTGSNDVCLRNVLEW